MVVTLYILLWSFVGFVALIVGVMLKPNILQTVSDLGSVWLGIAVSAGYAYFGLKPSTNE